MSNSISISDFSFEFQGRGAYIVKYTSPVTRKSWSTYTTNMRLIDNTKNSDEPKKCDLIRLKSICKNS